jgi:hypothetical protein
VREGLDTAGFAAVQAAAAAYAAGVGGALPERAELEDSGEVDDEEEAAPLATQLAARWAALGAARAVSPAGLAAGQAAAAGLGTAVSAARAASATELMGRRVLDGGQGSGGGGGAAAAAAAALAAASAAGRVLALLLSEPDRATRLALLADALDPGDGTQTADGHVSSDEDESADVEFISTTPLRLVQAVDRSLARLVGRDGRGGEAPGEGGGDSAPPSRRSLPGRGPPAAPEGGPALEAVLLELRRAALDAWDEEEGGGQAPAA